MVAVFLAEARRVLRADGSLLNLGNSYANDGKWGGSTGGKHAQGLHGASGVGRGKRHTGLKPKDLIGMPWRWPRAARRMAGGCAQTSSGISPIPCLSQ